MIMRLVHCFTIGLFVVGFASQAFAVQKIGVVDTHMLITQSKASADVSAQLTKIKDNIVKDLAKQENNLRKEEKSILEQKETLSEADFIKKVRAFEVKRGTFQKNTIEYRKKVSAASLKAEKALMIKITQVVADLSKEKGFDLVITKQNVILGSKSIDLTDDALAVLNKEMPRLKIEYSK